MTLDQLRVWEAIVRTGSFRAASLELNRAQSAVSYAIRRLENHLGVEVFSRKSYRPTLTREGQRLFEKAKTMLSSEREFQSLGRALSQGEDPEIELAVSALVPLNSFFEVFRTFQRNHPLTQLRLSIEVLGAQDRLDGESVSFAITEAHQIYDHKIEAYPLGAITMLPVVGHGHHLTFKDHKITHREVSQFTQIILKSSTELGQNRSAAIIEGGSQWRVTDFLTKKELLLGGFGWGFMPTHLIKDELSSGELKAINLESFEEINVDIYALRKRDQIAGQSAADLWNLLRTSQLMTQ